MAPRRLKTEFLYALKVPRNRVTLILWFSIPPSENDRFRSPGSGVGNESRALLAQQWRRNSRSGRGEGRRRPVWVLFHLRAGRLVVTEAPPPNRSAHLGRQVDRTLAEKPEGYWNTGGSRGWRVYVHNLHHVPRTGSTDWPDPTEVLMEGTRSCLVHVTLWFIVGDGLDLVLIKGRIEEMVFLCE